MTMPTIPHPVTPINSINQSVEKLLMPFPSLSIYFIKPYL